MTNRIPLSLTFRNGKLYYTRDLETKKTPQPIKGPIIGPNAVTLK